MISTQQLRFLSDLVVFPCVVAGSAAVNSKRCSRCGETKLRSEFYSWKLSKDGVQAHCKACQKAVSRNKHLRDKYGLSQEDYERLLAVQGGRCAACGSDDSGMVGYAFGVDHSHASGLVRGILCNGCNNALKNVGDSVERLELLIRYLEHHRLGVSDGVVATG